MFELHKQALVDSVEGLVEAYISPDFTTKSFNYRTTLWANMYEALDALIAAVRAESVAEYESRTKEQPCA